MEVNNIHGCFGKNMGEQSCGPRKSLSQTTGFARIWRQIVEDPALLKAAGYGPVWIWLGASSGLYFSKGLPSIDLGSIFH